MKKFIAYFDYLGFKKFIENNNVEYQSKIINNIFSDIARSLSKGKYIRHSNGVTADISNSKLNCINFSDTVVFWTNDDSEESLEEILKVTHIFNCQAILFIFPTRGSLVYGEIVYVDFKQENNVGGNYIINTLYGKGLVKAHEKAEKQHWAGTVIDQSLIEELINRGYQLEDFFKPYAMLYKVPYKNGQEFPDEYVFRLVTSDLNYENFKNLEKKIRENFAQHNKTVDSQDINEKIDNTIKFLYSFCV